jgi:hypothetical protein
MAQFLLLLHSDPAPWIKMPNEERQKWFAKYMAWGNQARQDGYVLGSNKLVDDPGKIIRGPKPITTDGPYSETKEILGGYYLIQAANYDEAVRRCKNHPHLEHGGTIEVRQIEQMPAA